MLFFLVAALRIDGQIPRGWIVEAIRSDRGGTCLRRHTLSGSIGVFDGRPCDQYYHHWFDLFPIWVADAAGLHVDDHHWKHGIRLVFRLAVDCQRRQKCRPSSPPPNMVVDW